MSQPDAKPNTETPLDWATYIDSAWLARRREEIIDPALPIVDPHHHLWPWTNYMLPALLADLQSGHNVVATVHLETSIGHYSAGPEHLKAVGETETLLGLRADPALAAPGAPDVCAGIIGAVDFEASPELVDETLAAHVRAGQGRFRGVRLNAMYADEFGWADARPGRLQDPRVRAGFARLAGHGLVSDVMVFHPQLPALAEFAGEFSETPIIVDHFGGILGRGPYAERKDEVFATWRHGIATLAERPNVFLKLGGLCNGFFSGWRFNEAPEPPSSEMIAEAYRPYFDAAVEAFGAERCMFESNFPADKSHCDYAVLWNAFKRLAESCTPEERQSLFSGTARRAYAL